MACVLLLACAMVIAAACGSSGSSGGAAASPQATSSGGGSPGSLASPATSATPLTDAEATAVRALTKAYWDAYNTRDPEAALALLSPEYRASAGESIRSEIGRLKTFGVKLGVTEKSPPEATGSGKAKLLVTIKTPIDTRTVVMQFSGGGDTWIITSAEE